METYEKKLEREKAERAAKIAERLARFDNIARLAGLGEAEEREADEYRAFRAYKWRDGASVWLESGSYNTGWETVSARGARPRSSKGEYVRIYEGSRVIQDPGANMSLVKTDEKIAAEIKRRVLEPFAPVLAEVLKSISETDNYERTTRETLEAVKGWPLTDDERETRRFREWKEDGPQIDISASRRSVTVALNYLDIETVKKVLEIVRACKKRGDS